MPGTLTPRELEVAKMVTEGRGNKEIAYALGVTVSTVNAHIMRGLKKTSAKNRTHFAVLVDRMNCQNRS